MGEKTEFSAGEKAPNTAHYIEIGENDRIMGINNPQKISLSAGDEFPNTSNHNRKWTKMESN
ncbi:YjzC family protein [Paenibacillus endoradicis]|uniref:YjzC family protein n=1 Tax=Paenibacillus endoradicis TaxID=2972487 RepID=UPI002159089B|nr:YjzC family protein [Paenibacillus endoradicis]MCR8660385.1 YjzC family protein [Paenibacillus endoradicis]